MRVRTGGRGLRGLGWTGTCANPSVSSAEYAGYAVFCKLPMADVTYAGVTPVGPGAPELPVPPAGGFKTVQEAQAFYASADSQAAQLAHQAALANQSTPDKIAAAAAQRAADQSQQSTAVVTVAQPVSSPSPTAVVVASAPPIMASPYTDSQLAAGVNTIQYSSSIPGDQLTRISGQVNANLAQYQRQGINEGSVLAYMLGLGSGQPEGAVVAPGGTSYTVVGGKFVLTSSIPAPSSGTTTSSGATTPLTPVAGGSVVVDSSGQVSADSSFPLLPVLIGGGLLAFFALGKK